MFEEEFRKCYLAKAKSLNFDVSNVIKPNIAKALEEDYLKSGIKTIKLYAEIVCESTYKRQKMNNRFFKRNKTK